MASALWASPRASRDREPTSALPLCAEGGLQSTTPAVPERLFGSSTPSIRIGTAVAEELLVDDPESVAFLKSLLGFSESTDADRYRHHVVLGPIHKRCTEQSDATFKVYPPQEVIDDPTITKVDDVVDRLKDKEFKILFDDGFSEIVSLQELMVFTQNLIFLSLQMQEIGRQLERSRVEGIVEVNLKTNVVPQLSMNPEVVRVLFSKISLEPESFAADK